MRKDRRGYRTRYQYPLGVLATAVVPGIEEGQVNFLQGAMAAIFDKTRPSPATIKHTRYSLVLKNTNSWEKQKKTELHATKVAHVVAFSSDLFQMFGLVCPWAFLRGKKTRYCYERT